MIHDQAQFDKFLEWMPETEQDEVYFVSLSARNKYLTDEEREFYGLGRTEMFSRTVVYDKEGLRYAMKKLEATLSYRKTKGGKPIPEKALVTYVNINPCSTIGAYMTFKEQMDNIMKEMLFSRLHDKEGPTFEPWHRIERHLMNNIQKSRGRKLLVDIDIDTLDTEILDEMQDFLRERDVNFSVVGTQGGFHVLIDKTTLHKLNIFAKVQELDKRIDKEVCINKNGMVPVPGTLQAGKLVKFWG